jgi:hypothetical protein
MIGEINRTAPSFEGPYWDKLVANLNQLNQLQIETIQPDTTTINPEDLTLITRLQNNNLPALLDSIRVMLESSRDSQAIQPHLDSLHTLLQDLSMPPETNPQPPVNPDAGNPDAPPDLGFNPLTPRLTNSRDISAVAVKELAGYLDEAFVQLISILNQQRNQQLNTLNQKLLDVLIKQYNNDLGPRLNNIVLQVNEAVQNENRADAVRTRLTVLNDEYTLIKQNLVRQDQDMTTYYFNTEWTAFLDLQKTWLTENTNQVVNATFIDRVKWAATGAFFISAGILLHKVLTDDTPSGGVDIDVQLPN